MNVPSGMAPSDITTFRVIVLDFDGVCTPTAGEFIEADGPLGTLRPGLESVIDTLRGRGSAIALLSNDFDRQWMVEINGFPQFDHVFVGSDNQIFKPDRRAFQRVLLTVGCDPNDCLVVDDDETNCRVARSIGCRTVRFDPKDVSTSWAAVLSASPGSEPTHYNRVSP